jgi:hypothetical protein
MPHTDARLESIFHRGDYPGRVSAALSRIR